MLTCQHTDKSYKRHGTAREVSSLAEHIRIVQLSGPNTNATRIRRNISWVLMWLFLGNYAGLADKIVAAAEDREPPPSEEEDAGNFLDQGLDALQAALTASGGGSGRARRQRTMRVEESETEGTLSAGMTRERILDAVHSA